MDVQVKDGSQEFGGNTENLKELSGTKVRFEILEVAWKALQFIPVGLKEAVTWTTDMKNRKGPPDILVKETRFDKINKSVM